MYTPQNWTRFNRHRQTHRLPLRFILYELVLMPTQVIPHQSIAPPPEAELGQQCHTERLWPEPDRRTQCPTVSTYRNTVFNRDSPCVETRKAFVHTDLMEIRRTEPKDLESLRGLSYDEDRAVLADREIVRHQVRHPPSAVPGDARPIHNPGSAVWPAF